MPRNAPHARNDPPATAYAHPIPSIRFISANPSTTVPMHMDTFPLHPPPAALAPRADAGSTPRKRLVPKKSKLGLLAPRARDKENARGTGSARGGTLEVYADACSYEDDASLVVVKKKKSRAALGAVGWGGAALGELTNAAPPAPAESRPATLKVPAKGDENQGSKWWSIGRGRRESKGKENGGVRSKTPEPFSTVSAEPEPRARFNSLDSSRLLGLSKAPDAPPQVPPKDAPAPPKTRQRSGTLSSLSTLLSAAGPEPADEGLLAPPTPIEHVKQGSIAVRAMKSMRSLARMKSWAALSSDRPADTKEGNDTTPKGLTKASTTATIKTKKKAKDKTKKKEERREERKEERREEQEEKKPERISISSFEAGALSTVPQSTPPPDANTINRKPSKLAIGGLLPGSLRLNTMRPMGSRVSSTSSTASRADLSPASPAPSSLYGLPNRRLSVDSSAHLVLGPNGRPASASSSGASLRPPSSASGGSGVSRVSSGMSASQFSTRSARSSSSSTASVRWDEEGLAGVRERQRREREMRREERRSDPDAKDSRRSADGRRRTAITEIFPEVRSTAQVKKIDIVKPPPVLTVEEATTDCETDAETPGKKARLRPVSEQLLRQPRPKAFSEGSEGVMSLLDAATNDLASLINRLDLEATPGSVQGSPIRPLRESPSTASLGRADGDSPLKGRAHILTKELLADSRDSTASIASLRTFAQTQQKAHPAAPPTRQQPMSPLEAHRRMIGQQIVPWSELDWQVSPKRKSVVPSKAARPAHKRNITPTPEVDLGPVFQPLSMRPAAPEKVVSATMGLSASAAPVPAAEWSARSSQTGSMSKGSRGAPADDEDGAPPSPTPHGRRARHSQRRSVLSVMCDKGVTLAPETLKSLGLSGTLGGPEPEIDPHDPDSDIPEELQVILAGQSDEDDTFEFKRAPSPGLPPLAALPAVLPEAEPAPEQAPAFRASLFDEHAHEADLDEGDGSASEDDTKKSFDFTGEFSRLTQAGGANRLSFVEQLENAFRTPDNVELGFNVGAHLFLKPDVAPLPAMALAHREAPDEDTVPQSVTSPEMSSLNFEPPAEESAEQPGEQSTDHSAEESYRNSTASDTLERLLGECEDDICRHFSGVNRSQSTMRSNESDGQLNTSFRFGGRPSIPDSVDESVEDRPLTLSDIIPPTSHSRSTSKSSMLGDDSLLKSILGNVYEGDSSVVNSIVAHAQTAAPRPRVNSGTSRKSFARNSARFSTHSRTPSELSFQGFESFEEVRRGFEFHPNRPAFYPPPGATTANRGWHNKHESFYSVASVSSYGHVVNSGVTDPFGYGPSRPSSYYDESSMSMSSTVDDTFSFIKKKAPQRTRLDSDASSFYFRPGARRGGHRRNESGFSVASGVPPISMYNRGFGGHRRNDSSASMASGMHSGRPAWSRHQDTSRDSIFSECSPARVARPGLGDKMFDMMDYGMPLEAITASPTGSVFSEQPEDDDRQAAHRDSIFSAEPRCSTKHDSIFSAEPKTTTGEDSIFEKTGQKMALESSDDVFEFDLPRRLQESYVRLHQFRPISMMSMSSVHTLANEEDTMISMLGGGHVRRRSVDSGVEGSPCVPLERERKKHTALQHLARVLQFDRGDDELPTSVPDRLSKISLEPEFAPDRLSKISFEDVPDRFSKISFDDAPDRLSKNSPEKIIVPKPSIASTSSTRFGSERMIVAGKGLLERQSLEESALMAQGEDFLSSFESNRVFSRPGRAARSRSSTVTSSSSGADTPPLLASDNSSVSSGSQYSIDIGHLNTLLSGAAHPAVARAARARARGTGHRRRFSQARASRSSVYETIQEETTVFSNSPSFEHQPLPASGDSTVSPSSPQHDSVFIVDPDTTTRSGDWDNESGFITLRKYYALRDEAGEIVAESKKTWVDTPFSVFAMQSFQPPASRSAMEALLEHSQQNYGPLPSELRPHRVRSRTSSRASPYPVRSRCPSIEQTIYSLSSNSSKPFASPDEHELSSGPFYSISINPNVSNPKLVVPEASKPSIKVFSAPLVPEAKPSGSFSVHVDGEQHKEKPAPKTVRGPPRQRVTSSARRSALGWSKKNGTAAKDATTAKNAATKATAAKTSTGSEKENSLSQSSISMSDSGSLRISRPRPKGRPALARSALAA